MSESNSPPEPQQQISIELGSNQLIRRVDTNVTQEIIVTTADKVRLCLIQSIDKMERRKAWIAPAGILVTLIVVFPTASFHEFIGLSKDYWQAVFSVAIVASLGWLVRCLIQIRASVTIEEIVETLRTSSLTRPESADKLRAPEDHQSSLQDDLTIVAAHYGCRDHRVDVASHLKRAISSNKLHVYVGNQIGGDPCPGTPKDLIVTYRFLGKESTETFAEGSDLDLPPPQ
jgi:hypothetical protein